MFSFTRNADGYMLFIPDNTDKASERVRKSPTVTLKYGFA